MCGKRLRPILCPCSIPLSSPVCASPARFVPDSELQRASVARSTVGQAAVVVGPALGSLVLLIATPDLAILLNALTFIASACAVGAIPAGQAFRPGAEASAGAATG